MYTSKTVTGLVSRESYQFPLFRSCNCEVIWKLKYDLANRLFCLLCNGVHNGQSHANHQGKFLDPFQKAAVVRAVRNDPNVTATIAIRNMANVGDERVQIDHSLKGSVDLLVKNERDAVCSKVPCVVTVGGSIHEEVKKLPVSPAGTTGSFPMIFLIGRT